ncbi:MAG: glycosyltransferase family 4 protein [Candidatus Omnitrophica bacterium]|nr:glycosyltransferase family 4 protein [Candidatus Omnitrophota bacterium]
MDPYRTELIPLAALPPTPKINIYGNVCNNAYSLAKGLRAGGLDARLILEADCLWRPEQEDPELEGAYPDWIRKVPSLRLKRFGLGDRSFVKTLGDCDLVHTFYYGPIWARKTGRPSVFHTYGGDLNVFPFMKDNPVRRYLAFRQRQGLRDMDLVLLNSNFGKRAAEQLQLKRTAFIPLFLDVGRFHPLDPEAVARARAEYNADWIFFHPTRQAWTDQTGPWERKGNHRLFRAWAQFLKKTQKKARLLAIAHGPDLEHSRALVRELGIGDHVQWLPRMSRHELVKYYNLCHAVFDQFVMEDYGTIASETWACERPVFMNLKHIPELFEEAPPVIQVSTEKEILAALIEHTEDPQTLKILGARSREWVMKYLQGPKLFNRYMNHYNRLLEKS